MGNRKVVLAWLLTALTGALGVAGPLSGTLTAGFPVTLAAEDVGSDTAAGEEPLETGTDAGEQSLEAGIDKADTAAGEGPMETGADAGEQSLETGIDRAVMAVGEEPLETGADAAGGTGQVLDALPSYWFAGDYGMKPTVRSQGKYGTCWALSAASALEAMLLPEKQMEFSAEHFVLGSSFDIGMNDGGSYYMTLAYLSGWQGPVLEADDPYGDAFSPEGLTPAVHVQEIQVLENADTEQLKQAVSEYGVVQTSLYMSRKTTNENEAYYQESTSSYYYPETMLQDHDILILGWDDHWSRYNFKQTPQRDGAFICQNAWGSEFGEDGIFYVSYEDANIGSANLIYSRIESADNYDRIYQSDECGWQGRLGYGTSTGWFANVYTSVQAEMLAAVGFYATAPGMEYELYLVHEYAGTETLAQREFLQSGTLENIGYYTIDLEEPETLAQGERFAVVVKAKTPGTENPIAAEYAADEFTQSVTLEGKEGYISQWGTDWQSTEEGFGANVCLKAYTRAD